MLSNKLEPRWSRCLVLNFDQIKPMRRSGRAGLGAITYFKQFTERLRRAQTAAYLDKGADDIAHHVAEERGGFDREYKQIASFLQHSPIDRSNRMRRIATGSTERRKVMLTEQARNRLAHRRKVQGFIHVPRAVQVKRRPGRAVEDPILIDPTPAVAPCIEGVGNDLDVPNRNFGGSERIEAAGNTKKINFFFIDKKIGHLAERMNSRVRAPGTGDAHGGSQKSRCGALQNSLDGFTIALELPAAKGGAVIFNRNFNIHKRWVPGARGSPRKPTYK